MTKRTGPRKLLSSAARVGTLIVIGVAETACNLRVGGPEIDTVPSNCDTDAGDTDSDCQDDAARSTVADRPDQIAAPSAHVVAP